MIRTQFRRALQRIESARHYRSAHSVLRVTQPLPSLCLLLSSLRLSTSLLINIGLSVTAGIVIVSVVTVVVDIIPIVVLAIAVRELLLGGMPLAPLRGTTPLSGGWFLYISLLGTARRHSTRQLGILVVVLKHSFVEGLDGASIKSKGLTITIVGEMDGPEQASNVVSMRIVFLVDEDSFVILSLLLVPTRHELHRFR